MSDDGEVVHKLLIGEQPFAIIADAIQILSVERLKFQRLKDVIVEVVNSVRNLPGSSSNCLRRSSRWTAAYRSISASRARSTANSTRSRPI